MTDEDEWDLDVKLSGFRRTDCGNAQRLVARFGDKIRFCHDRNRGWWIFDGQAWIQDSAGCVVEFAKQTAREILAEAQTIPSDDDELHTSWGVRSQSLGRIRAMLKLAQSDPAVAVVYQQLNVDSLASK